MTAAMIAPTIAGVILAGGRSARFGGGDKCLAPLGGRPMLAHVIDRLRPGVAALALSANGDPARFHAFGLPVLADTAPGHPGPLAGVLAGMDWGAARGFEAVVTAAADTPVFPDDLVTALRAAAVAAGRPLAIALTPTADGGLKAHPTFGLWPVALREDLRAALADGQRRAQAWAEAQGCARAIFHDRGADLFLNVNTPADLAEAEAGFAARS